MRRLAITFNISVRSMRQIINEELRYKSYTLKVRQMLSEAAKIKRVACCHLILTSLRHETAGHLRFFSDEKIFTVDQKHNPKNDRWLAKDPADVPIVHRTKHSANVHVLSVVSNEGDAMPPHFFDKHETVTKEVYLRVLQRVVKPWIDRVSNGKQYVFQQDGAPAHTSNLVQDWLRDNMTAF